MTSTNCPSGAHDALLDEIERELAALTFVPLDAGATNPAPQHCVDEFSDTFLNWSMPPPQARARHSLR
jgi:hypothetical protein